MTSSSAVFLPVGIARRCGRRTGPAQQGTVFLLSAAVGCPASFQRDFAPAKMLAAVVRGDPAVRFRRRIGTHLHVPSWMLSACLTLLVRSQEVRSYIEDEGFDVNEANAGAHGNTPLMVACAPSEKLGVLSLLLDCKHLAKDAVNRRGMTGSYSARQLQLCIPCILSSNCSARLQSHVPGVCVPRIFADVLSPSPSVRGVLSCRGGSSTSGCVVRTGESRRNASTRRRRNIHQDSCRTHSC